MNRRHTGLAAIALVLGLLLAACGGGGSDPEGISLQELADAAFADQDGLVRATVSETPEGESMSVDLAVVLEPEASADQAGKAAATARAFSEEHVADGRWTSQLYVGEPARVQIEIYPTVIESADGDARAAFDLAELPNVLKVATAGGTPYVTAADVATVTALVPSLRAHPLWPEGGSIQAEDGRLRIMDSPQRVTTAQLAAILAAAESHPAADFALEAAATGERYPELYVNRLTVREAAAVTAAFSDPALRSHHAEGYELGFTMRAFGTDGNTVDSGGTFGRQ